jgi:hypothetical protein
VIVAEFLFIAFVVGILTETWVAFLATFFGLYALYRFTRLSAVLSLALSSYWGLLGYHLGASIGGTGVAPLLAVLGFAVGAWAHRDGFRGATAGQRASAADSAPTDVAPQRRSVSPLARPFSDEADGEVIDVEYRVVS